MPLATTTSASRTAPSISPAEVVSFCEFFYRKTGIRLDAERRYFIDRRLEERMAANRCATFREYFTLIKFQASGVELQALINEMTVNETYFFREDYQFACLAKHMLDEIAARKTRGERIRIWSVPCSTGEEPYSIAIYILEHWARADDFDIEIVASDIDSRVLARSREGIYEERALHRLPASIRKTYFNEVAEGRWQIIKDLRQSIEFSSVNIGDPVQMARMRGFDAIFCRNLLIYFDETSRRRAAESFYEALNPGGFVALGHSESMSRISSLFLPRKFPEALVHQKPLS